MRIKVNFIPAPAALHALPLALALLAGCDGDAPRAGEGLIIVGGDPSDAPLAALDAAALDRFNRGDALFEQPFRESQGLGPLYIRQSCASCHAGDGKGPGAVTKMAAPASAAGPGAGGGSLTFPYGHTVRPQRAAGATRGIELVPDAISSLRVGPAVFARGYLEAIPDEEIERLERGQATAGGPVSGRIHRVAYQSEANPDQRFHLHQPGQTGLVGRFGLKAQIATLDELAADALQGDMGLTSPLRPTELPNPDGLADDLRPGLDVDAEAVNLLGDYVRALAIPRRRTAEAAGATSFAAAGCATCHVPSLTTRADYPIAALASVDAPVFTDLLLHDMGTDLADGVTDGDATGTEWRTAPLVGLRFFRGYLHDGRARTLRQAIELHAGPGSEAAASAASFQSLPAADQEALLAFVAGL